MMESLEFSNVNDYQIDKLIEKLSILEKKIAEIETKIETKNFLEINEITFEPYKNCFKIIGNTTPYKEIIKKNYGKWNPTFKCWIVGKTKVDNMKEVLNKIENIIIC